MSAPSAINTGDMANFSVCQKVFVRHKKLKDMNRRGLLLTVAVGVSGLAGCQNNTCPHRLHVQQSDANEVATTDRDVIPYQQLSEERQQEFIRVLEGGDSEIDDTVDEWVSTYFVKYRDDYYVTTVAVC